MKTTKLILVRHGQSQGNKKHVYLGHTDWDLSEEGYKQAELLCEYLKSEKIDAVYSSDLMRAYNTVLPTAKAHGLEIIKNEKLREIYAGEWEGKTYEQLTEQYAESYKIWRTDIGNARCDGGESVLELKARAGAIITQIAEKNIGKTVLVGTHATLLRTFNAYCNNVEKDDIKDIPWMVNASVTRAEFFENKFKITEYGYSDFLGDMLIRVSRNV